MNPVAQYILKQHEPFPTILLQLQSLTEQAIPGCALKYKYRIKNDWRPPPGEQF